MFLLQRKETPTITLLIICVTGFSLWILHDVKLTQETTGITFGGWEYLFLNIGSTYLINYCLIPFAIWFLLRQYTNTNNPENLTRHGTKTKWAYNQIFIALEWILLLVCTPILIGLIISTQFPWQWEWSTSLYENIEIVQQDLATIIPVLPHPAIYLLVLAIQHLFIYATIVAIISLLTIFIQRPQTPIIAGGALFAWFILIQGFSEIPATAYLSIFGYSSPAAAVISWGVSPFTQIAILIAAGIISYLAINYLEIHKEKKITISWKTLVILSAMLLLIGTYALHAAGSSTENTEDHTIQLVAALQGSTPEGMSFIDFLAVILLVTLPAYLIQTNLTTALTSRRYQEIIRHGSASKWFYNLIRQQSSFIFTYCLISGLVVVILFRLFADTWPNSLHATLIGLWMLALFLQVLVCTLMLAFGIFTTKKVTGGLYALGAFIILAGSWGTISYWLPAGLPSMSKLIDLHEEFSSHALNFTPLISITIWLIILTVGNHLVLKHTRAEIH